MDDYFDPFRHIDDPIRYHLAHADRHHDEGRTKEAFEALWKAVDELADVVRELKPFE